MSNWTGTVPTFVAGSVIRGADLAALATLQTAQTDAWTSYTPVLTGLSIGNGTVSARYKQIGKDVWYRGSIMWGSTTSASGDWNISLPVNTFTAPGAIGSVIAVDSSASVSSPGIAALFGSIVFFVVGTKNVSNTQPWTWATSDSLLWTIRYEIT